ncbi:MAG: hypothetical protein ABFS86_18465 [Planctomycetota bacterium]
MKSGIVEMAVQQPRLEVKGVTEEMYDVRVVLAYASADIEDVEGVPLDEPAVIVVRSEGGVRFFPLGPAKDGVRRAVVTAVRPPPLREEEAPEPPDFDRLRLLDAEGRPIAGRAVRIFRHSASGRGVTDGDGFFNSRWKSIATTGGGPVPSPFVLEVEGWLTRVVTVEKPGDLTVRYPAGAIDLTVDDADGAPLDFAWCVDGMTGRGKGGKLTLRGVEPGRRTVVVGAAGYGSRLFVIDVPPEGAKPLPVVLNR